AVNRDVHAAKQRNTSVVHRSSAQATALPRPRLSGLPSPPLAELKADSNLQLSARSAPVEQEALLLILQERPGMEAMQLLWEVVHLELANRRLLEDLDLPLLAIRRLPEANPLAEPMQLLWELGHLGAANRPLLEDLDLRQTEQRLALVRRPAAPARQ